LLHVLLGYDGFGEVMRPSPSLSHGSSPAGLVNQSNAHSDKLIQSDLDGSLALLAGNLSIRPDGQMKKYAPFAVNDMDIYRPRSRGDNTFGSVWCVRVCPCICLSALSSLNRLTFDLDFWHKGRP